MAKKKDKDKGKGKGKAKGDDGGIYVSKPKADVYLALLILTLFAMIGACGIMYYEYTLLNPQPF